MTADAKQLIDGFQALPDATKREVLAELVRISRHLDYPSMSDDELVSAADGIFVTYDRREDAE
jgi:DNA-binding transcriptional ArsR family regulator